MDKRRRAKKSVLVMIMLMALLVSVQAAEAGWTNVTPANSTKTLYGIWGTSPSNIYALGQDGAILHYDGTAWTAETSGTTEKLNAIWGVTETNIYAVGENGTLLHKTAAGTTWGAEPLVDYKDQNDFNDTDLYSVRGSSAQMCFSDQLMAGLYVLTAPGGQRMILNRPPVHQKLPASGLSARPIYIAQQRLAVMEDFSTMMAKNGNNSMVVMRILHSIPYGEIRPLIFMLPVQQA